MKCSARPITSADYLYLALLRDYLPEQADECTDDYGFSLLHSFGDKTRLFGLYQGLFFYQHVTSEQVHQWRSEGSLEANIIATYTAVPEQARGGYFSWFMENRHKLRLDAPKPNGPREPDIDEFLREARTYLEPSERSMPLQLLQPPAKGQCLRFYAMVLNQCHPPPTMQDWFDFGFCTVYGIHPEGDLSSLYSQLIVGNRFLQEHFGRVKTFPQKPVCTFSEFWQAFEGGTLLELMDSYGLAEERARFPQLNIFLGRNVEGQNWTVWYLNQFLADESSQQPPPSVWVDFGFFKCTSFAERLELRKTYQELLGSWGVEVVELQHALMRGNLFELARKHIPGLHPKFRRLMESLPED